MPRLETFEIEIVTGAQGRDDAPKFSINGFDLDFETSEGGTGPGETFRATGAPGSFPHTLLLLGPDSGTWEIDRMQITYYPAGEGPYTVRFGAVSVGDDADLNIMKERPLVAFDV